MSNQQAKAPDTETLRRNNLDTLRGCRLCIICATAQDAVTVKDQLGAKSKIEGHLVDRLTQKRGESGHDFYLGVIDSPNGDISYYITNTTRQGIQTFGVQAAALLTILEPRFAVHIGACAAIKGKGIEIEDVIFGERALNYEEGKWEVAEDDAPEFVADIMHYSTKSDCMNGFLTEKGRPYWKHGDFISGCAIRMDNKKILERVKNAGLREFTVLETEASAFLQACDCTHVQAFGVIKGVSDIGDKHRGLGHKAHYDKAVRNAAKATREFVEWKLKHIPFDSIDIERQPGAQRVEGYFNNFVTPVVTKIFGQRKIVSFGEGSISTEKRKIKGFSIVMPKGNNVSSYNNLQIIVNNHDLEEVKLPGGDRTSILYAKGPYLVDFPTNLKELAKIKNIDVGEQVEFFKIALEARFVDLNDNGFTQAVSWQRFEELCSEVESTANPPEAHLATPSAAPSAAVLASLQRGAQADATSRG